MFDCGKTPRYDGGTPWTGWTPNQIQLTQPSMTWQYAAKNPLAFSDMKFKVPTNEDLRK